MLFSFASKIIFPLDKLFDPSSHLSAGKDTIGSPETGTFPNLQELIRHYDTDVNNHVLNHQKGTVNYLSPKIQSEFFNLLDGNISGEIIYRIKN